MTDSKAGESAQNEALAVQTVAQLRTDSQLQALWQTARASRDEMVALLTELVQIPAPTFHEGPRGDRAAEVFKQFTGETVHSDEVGNRWITLTGSQGPGPRILACAHLDTVFSHGTDCTVRTENGRLIAPGIGDDGSGLVTLLTGAKLLCAAGRPFPGELILATNVGEEGLGNLRGVRALCDRFARGLDGFLSVDGGIGNVVGEAVGGRRYRVTVTGPGGHSWSDFGTPSAIHHLANIAANLTELEAPASPRTTFNIGVIKGGTSVNSIAQQAELLLDLRSVDAAAVAGLDARAQKAIGAAGNPPGLNVQVDLLGERPTGDGTLTRDWITLASAVWKDLGQSMKVTASSTDANVPLALGLRASTFGVCQGGRAHTTDEWLDPACLPQGLEAFLLLILAAMRTFPHA